MPTNQKNNAGNSPADSLNGTHSSLGGSPVRSAANRATAGESLDSGSLHSASLSDITTFSVPATVGTSTTIPTPATSSYSTLR